MNKIRPCLIYIFVFIAILPTIAMRDYTPDNELKYLNIADEAIENSHVFAFYNHGEVYADKPPLYLWFVMLGKILFGEHIMLFLSLFSVIPAFVTAHIMGKFVKGLMGEREILYAKLMLFTTLFYLAPMIVLRMDMLMIMFITLSFYCFYQMYSLQDHTLPAFRKMQWLLPLWVFFAIFSKGAVGFLLPVIVIAVFLAVTGKIKSLGKYLGWRFWLLLAALCGAWFTCVYIEGREEYLNNLLFHQTIDRAVDAFHHKKPVYYYFVVFWYIAAPWSLLSVASIIDGYRKRLINNTFSKLSVTIFFTTVIMLSCISSKMEIYLLPAFPFMIFLAAYILGKGAKSALAYFSVAIVSFSYILIFAATLFTCRIEEAAGMEIRLWAPLWVLALILLAGAVIALMELRKKQLLRSAGILSASLLLFLFAASFSITSFNSIIGMRNGCEKAAELAKEIGTDKYLYYDFSSGINFNVYLGKPVEKVNQEQLPEIEKAILFIKTRSIPKDTLLMEAIGEKEIITYGTYSIIPFN